MKQNIFIAVALNVLMSGLFIACGGSKSSENKSDTTTVQKIEAVEVNKDTVTETSVLKKDDPYKVIVMYTTLDPEMVSEDWVFFAEDIRSAFQNTGVFVVENKGSKAIIDNENLSLEIDLTEILKKNNIGEVGAGYIFIENGKEPKFNAYSMSDQTIRAAEEYFGIKAGD